MLTIAGYGMTEATIKNLKLELKKYDKIICDKNFKDDGENILKLSYKDAKEYILQNYDKEELLYVVSGSPLFFSAGTIITKSLPKDKVIMIDNTSSKSYLLSKLCIAENEVATLSLHGRKSLDLSEFLTKRYTFLLCDEKTIDKLKEYLKWIDEKELEITIGYKLGFSDERIEKITLDTKEFDLKKSYVLLIERKFEQSYNSQDSEFETQRGMITKKLKRDLALASLELKLNETLWDIGSGSGSCAIEAYKRYRVKTYLFEKQPQRVEFIKKNLTTHKVVDATLLEGNAEEFFEKLEEDPDKIFVGGGGEEVIKKLPYLYERLKSGGIIVVHAITLKNLSQMITLLDSAGLEYEVSSHSFTTYKGKLNMAEPQRELFSLMLKKVG